MTKEEFNAAVSAWGAKIRAQSVGKLQASVRVWPASGKKPLAKTVKERRYDDKDSGEAVGLGIKMAKHGVYVHYGVGRGYVSSGGVLQRAQRVKVGSGLYNQMLKRGYSRREIKSSFVAGSGEIRRRPVDWLDSVLKENIGELADITAEYHGDESMRKVLEVLDRATIGVRS